jgi:uncharacterized protein YqgC (DUF456 family)
MTYLALILLVVAVIAGWLLTLFSLPGNWLMVASAALYAYAIPPESAWGMSWAFVGVLAALALAGEAIELVASALGAKKHGGSKRGALLAIVGSMIGAMFGATLGLPIPVVGSIAGVVLGASLGAMIGAMLGEIWKGRDAQQTWKIGGGAFWGRLWGTVAKTAVGTLMAVLVLAVLALDAFRVVAG